MKRPGFLDNSFRRAYTLVELIVVIGIFMVVMGVSLPAFTRLAKGNGVTMASRNLAAKLNGARSYALSHRCYVALVFPTASTIDANVPDNLRYTSYRPAIVYPQASGSNSYVFSKWVDGELWSKMPAATFFGGPKYDISLAADGMASFVNPQGVASCDFSDVAASSVSGDVANCVVFTPAGTLGGGSSNPLPFCMGAWEGGINAGGKPLPTNKSNMVKITVNQFTGRPVCSGR